MNLGSDKKSEVRTELHHRRPQTACVFQNRNTLQLKLATSSAGRQRTARQSPELGDKCTHGETNVRDWKRHAAQSWVTNKGLQGRGGHSSQSWETNVKLRIARQRRTRETIVNDCKRHAAQSWETNVKDCRAEQLGDKCDGLQARGGERRHM